MTFKQLVDKYDYAAIKGYVEAQIAHDEADRRPWQVKVEGVEQCFDQLKRLTPTFGYVDTCIDAKMLGGRLNVSNMHLGSMSDLLSHRLAVAPGVEAAEAEILAHCVYQLAARPAATEKYLDDDDFDDLDNPMMSRGMR